MNATEQLVQRQLTAAFIEADFEMITLIPRELDKTSTGGKNFIEQPPREPQKFHIIEKGGAKDGRVAGGTQHEEEFTLLGNWDALIGKHDVFTLRGNRWEVVKVEWGNGYEQRALVLRYGR